MLYFNLIFTQMSSHFTPFLPHPKRKTEEQRAKGQKLQKEWAPNATEGIIVNYYKLQVLQLLSRI